MCLTVSSCRHNTHFGLSCQLRFTMLSLLMITLLPRYNPIVYTSLANSSFPIFKLLLSSDPFDWIIVLYIEYTENLPLSCRLHRNSSVLGVNWTKAKCCSKACHRVSLGLNRSLLNITFGREDSHTLKIVSF
jgi:hypothetical protein